MSQPPADVDKKNGPPPEDLDSSAGFSVSSGSTSGDNQINPHVREEITTLARTVTGISQHQLQPIEDELPFDSDPEMDPRSGKFDFEKWIHAVVSLLNRYPDKNPTIGAGVSFTNLNVHGYGVPTDHQKTVGNILLDIPGLIRNLLGHTKQRIDILRGFEGLVKQGEMLVVLGPPGSGCTTLLKTIAGETHGFYVDDDAKVNYQSIPWDLMHTDFRGEAVYNAENDIHFPNLTVGQTLSFAAQARCPHTRFPGVTRAEYAQHMKDVIMTVFGLSHTENTKVGNDFIRGVSGGERKRVSIAETVLSGSPLQCWDNSKYERSGFCNGFGICEDGEVEYIQRVLISEWAI
ncbi:P-loop containing nucleoside triphosphate hydrolase protein [Dendrothele bispora CBS 962.96]|uniref:P-loop containing nucleoside triphosphate hydrolase protein n=1 Tax=Dendrothele bispora (strain CBS 962.96) TaxID=1314807 RepID=A0A4S8MRD4_DENBC|nr:P-loop containing nucleoside triphosphate hydrolase protein [Dendrothele bispora CBS 962.96]